jgi:hypothetical protein
VTVYNEHDPECIGGVKNGDTFDVCPAFAECKLKVCGPPKTASRRAAAPKPAATEADSAVHALEQEMRQALKR